MPISRVYLHLLAAFTASSVVTLCLLTFLRRDHHWIGRHEMNPHMPPRRVHSEHLAGAHCEEHFLDSSHDKLKRFTFPEEGAELDLPLHPGAGSKGPKR